MEEEEESGRRSSVSIRTILVYLSLLLASPLVLFASLLAYLYKKCVLLIVKVHRPKLQELLSDRENFYVAADGGGFWKRSRASIGLILTLEGKVTVDQLRQVFTNRVLEAKCPTSNEKLFPRLTQIPQSYGGYWFWQGANYFLLHEHIRHVPLSSPSSGDNNVDQEDLKLFMSALMNSPFPNKRPLWEILVLSERGGSRNNNDGAEGDSKKMKMSIIEMPNDEEGDKFAGRQSKCDNNEDSSTVVILRLHHAIADMEAVLRLASSLLCTKSEGRSRGCTPGADTIESLTRHDTLIVENEDLEKESAHKLTFLGTLKAMHNFLTDCCTGEGVEDSGGGEGNRPSPTLVSWASMKKDSSEATTVPLKTLLPRLVSNSRDSSSQCPVMILQNANAYGTVAFSTILGHDHFEEDRFIGDLKSSIYFLRYCTLFPSWFLRCLTSSHFLKGSRIIFQEKVADFSTFFHLHQKGSGSNNSNMEFYLTDSSHQLLGITPFSAPVFQNNGIAITCIRFNDTVKVGLSIKSSMLPALTSTTSSFSIKQLHCSFKSIVLDEILTHWTSSS